MHDAMNPCQNCGKANSPETNFCRFCGTKFVYRQGVAENPYDYTAPRPYAWKTDEFDSRKTTPGVLNPAGQPYRPAALASPHAQPLAPYANQQLDANYRCPRCGSSYFPVIDRRISTAGWIVFSVLLVTTVIFFWVGLCLKENVMICPACRSKLS